jgi:hypothetical protein
LIAPTALINAQAATDPLLTFSRLFLSQRIIAEAAIHGCSMEAALVWPQCRQTDRACQA